MLRYFNGSNNNIIIMPLSCYVVNHLFCIPPVEVVWWRTASHIGALTTGMYEYNRARVHRMTWVRFLTEADISIFAATSISASYPSGTGMKRPDLEADRSPPSRTL
jgi:hypothetical protein